MPVTVFLFLVSTKIKGSLNYIFRLTTLRTMAGTSAPHCGNSTFRETRFVTVFRIINFYIVWKFLAWHQSIFQWASSSLSLPARDCGEEHSPPASKSHPPRSQVSRIALIVTMTMISGSFNCFFIQQYHRDNKISHIDAADSFEEVIKNSKEFVFSSFRSMLQV